MPSASTQAERIEWVRHMTGMQSKAFAKALGVEPSSYSNWLHGKYGISLHGCRLLHDKYGVSTDWILYGEVEQLSKKLRQAWELRL